MFVCSWYYLFYSKSDRSSLIPIPWQTAMEWTRSTPLQFATEVLLLLYQESLFTIHTVHELLWGYKDRLLSTIHLLHPEIDPVFGFFNKVTGMQDLLMLWMGNDVIATGVWAAIASQLRRLCLG